MIRVKFVSINVTDQDRAVEFWTQKVGLKVKTDAPVHPNQRWIELEIPGDDTRLVLYTPEGQEDRIGSFTSMGFGASDVQSEYERLLANGVEFQQPPKTAPWGTHAIFKDPDGNLFVIGSED